MMHRQSSASILIVDDEELMQQILARTLRRGGYTKVTTASSADEARRLLVDEPFDLVLTDMQMPGGSGLELLRHVHDQSPGTATMMVTGVDDPELAASALDLGAYGYVIKPFKASEILIDVNNALRRRALELENVQHRERLEEMVKARTADLWQTVDKLEVAEREVSLSRTDTIHRLAIAAEFRDDVTGRHVARMSRYCELLAQASGQDDELTHTIREASSLHDVGKIGIPDSILLKPAFLSPEERAIMNEHAQIGYEILSGSTSPLLNLSASIASTHHERIDAAGYPRGLKGLEIPVAGRIAAVADVFDALTNDRPYRRAFSVPVAIEMMKAESGSHFDPDLLDCFWNVVPDALAIDRVNNSMKPREGSVARVLEGLI